MYTPAHFEAGPDAISDLLTRPAAANLVTMTPQGLLATLLPFVYDPSIGERGALLTHVARNNAQWSEPVTGEALAILQGADAYISPSWYASKAEHGRVVPPGTTRRRMYTATWWSTTIRPGSPARSGG